MCSDVTSWEQSNAQLSPTVLSSTPSSSTDSPATRSETSSSLLVSKISFPKVAKTISDDDLTEMKDEDFQTVIEASLMSGVDSFM